jgi:phosphoketolase
VLPILHLNGYKIAEPVLPRRIPKDELPEFFEGYGYAYFVEGEEPGDAQADGGSLESSSATSADPPTRARTA